MGRRQRFPEPGLAYKAAGLICQGGAADLMKLKAVEISEALGDDAQLVLAVHDEFDIVVQRSKANKVAKTVKEIMEDLPQLRVPTLADIGRGPNWSDACL